MSYATAAQMEEQFGLRELIALTDRDNIGVVDSAVLARAQGDADAEIDSYLAGRYTLPLTGTFPVLVRHACNMARYHLSGAEVTEVEAVRNRYKDAIRWLESVRDGKTRLAANAIGDPAPESARISVVGSGRTFTADTLGEFTG
jgi:phage gp36-like protein